MKIRRNPAPRLADLIREKAINKEEKEKKEREEERKRKKERKRERTSEMFELKRNEIRTKERSFMGRKQNK